MSEQSKQIALTLQNQSTYDETARANLKTGVHLWTLCRDSRWMKLLLEKFPLIFWTEATWYIFREACGFRRFQAIIAIMGTHAVQRKFIRPNVLDKFKSA